MSKIFIAFIECKIYGDPPLWEMEGERMDPEEYESLPNTREFHIAIGDGAKVSLVDLAGTRRYYIFKAGGFIEILGNVAIFKDDYLDDELAVDEDKQFPKKKRIDE